MAVTGQRGGILLRDHHALRGTAAAGEKSRLGAHRHLDHAVRGGREVPVGQVRVHAAHHLVPHCRGGVARGGDLGGRIVADPDRAGIVGRKAAEITVVSVAGGTGLAGDGHAREGSHRARAVAHDALEKLVDGIDRALLHRDPGLRRVVEHDVALGVQHLRIGARTGIDAVAGKGGVGRRHFHSGHAVGHAAHAQRAVIQVVMHQRGKAQLFGHERVGRGQRQLLQRAYSTGVGGLPQGFGQRDKT